MSDAVEWFSKAPSSKTVYRLPRSHRDCHLHNFRWDLLQTGEAKAEALRKFMEAHLAGDAPHLVMTGRHGAGKTHLAIGLYRWAVYQEDVSRAMFLNIPRFCVEVKRGFSTGEDPFFSIPPRSLVVLDDLFGRELSDWEGRNVLPRLIDDAYTAEASLVSTCNMDVDEIGARVSGHELSRLLTNATVMDFSKEKDRRMMKVRR